MENNNFIAINDELFNSSVRLSIMLILYSHKRIYFSELQKILKVTSGNLNFHLEKLSAAKYVIIRKSLLTGRLLTTIEITKSGKNSFKGYLSKFREIINDILGQSD